MLAETNCKLKIKQQITPTGEKRAVLQHITNLRIVSRQLACQALHAAALRLLLVACRLAA